MKYPLCRHIRARGVQCQAPALKDELHCYFHKRLYQRHSGFRHTAETKGYLIPGQHIELAPLEDRESIQVALSVVINALATGQLETRRATALLYGLQMASSNVIRRDALLHLPYVVTSVEVTPEGFELADPGAVYDDDPIDEEEDDEEDLPVDEDEENQSTTGDPVLAEPSSFTPLPSAATTSTELRPGDPLYYQRKAHS